MLIFDLYVITVIKSFNCKDKIPINGKMYVITLQNKQIVIKTIFKKKK